ncbi:MAG: hypothetical protein AVDCRST_MAG86-199 [uncultured Truepera sp.]|uniref:Uncharacterized protein n=1 Tax=uncultured Truepera sp. TaxID=543023 RepID=A0A6J4UP18_9DEIN|nr:MAG: hypothetical protein AVDCRST_MAG86-199 [uncultured Truepera sp.]
MQDKLSQFFGQDTNREQEYSDFERRYREDPDSISDEEAARRYREIAQHDDDMDDPQMDSEYERAFSRMSSDERRELARHYQEASRNSSRSFQGYRDDYDLDRAASPRELGRMTRQASQQDPDLLESLLGGNSPLASTGGKIAMAGLAAMAAKKFLGRR